MSLRIDWLPRDRLPDWMACDAAAFGTMLQDDDVERFGRFLDFDRAQAAFDGEEIVSTACVFPFEATVPGGLTQMAGVTWVSVKPTHRRRGIVSEMMRFQLNDIREREEPIAGLWASESIIYGRFGYGLSTQSVEWTIDRRSSGLAPGPAPVGRYRMVSKDEAARSWPAFHDRVRITRPGMFARERNEEWWRELRYYEPGGSKGKTPYWVQYERDGEIVGYVCYRVENKLERGLPANRVEVTELIVDDDEAYAALWRYVFGIDLVSEVIAYRRPVDEPLVHMLADTRRLARHPMDGLWVRIVDAPAALSARRYRHEGELVLDVTDPFLEWGGGRYLLKGGPDGATCTPTDQEPDIRMGVRDLGAAYMGDTKFTTLAAAGRVEGDRPMLLRADEMFDWDPKPWCPELF